MTKLAWGAKVSPQFRSDVVGIAGRLQIDPSWLMACMAFETGATFRSDIRNAAGSGAVGLIQFMPSTCAGLGVSSDVMAAMSPTTQLAYVERYFHRWAGKMKSLGDVYGVILWPNMVGKPDTYVVFDKADPLHPKRFVQNAGLDKNKDGKVTKAEVVGKVQAMLDRGLLPQNTINI